MTIGQRVKLAKRRARYNDGIDHSVKAVSKIMANDNNYIERAMRERYDHRPRSMRYNAS